ncbi:efflux RND transporter permease subunit [Halocatena marina]|uniref:efflux RND transporter permease subunit n=1 Tax=Halocatena marina TaxID=2934937 RepID=UPI002223F567|nr:MMPL family transporter [Halocatena marina]
MVRDREDSAADSDVDGDAGMDPDTDRHSSVESESSTNGGERGRVNYQAVIDLVDEWITERPRAVILTFFLLTAVFSVGLGNISTEAGTEQFTKESPSQEALEEVNQEFSPAFETTNGTTQLIQQGTNVLSKGELLAILEVQQRLQDRENLRVVSTSSAAAIVAQTIDPNATTVGAQIDAIEGASRSEVEDAVQRAAQSDGFRGIVSDDFNREAASASATIGVVEHEIPGGVSTTAGQGGTSPLTPIQTTAQSVVGSVDSDITVFGSGIIAAENGSVITDSMLIITPAAVLLIFAFLIYSYRDPLDLLLGVIALGMAIVWTFGFLGIAGIPFSQLLIAVPPLLLAVGIDFGIHAINRYREERVEGKDVGSSMRIATDQLLVAFFIVTGTTVMGFSSNGVSDLPPIRDFGFVAAIGIVFTFLIFGIFLPAAKVFLDELSIRRGLPRFGEQPLGSEGSALSRVLPVGLVIARKAPYVFLIAVLLFTAGSSYYATGVDTSFNTEDFLPPEDVPDYLESLPEPFAPNEYTVTKTTNFLEENFASAEDDTVTIYAQGSLTADYALESIHHANRDPPDSFIASNRRADAQSILMVIDDYAAQSPEFRRLVERNDVDDDGVPDDNLEEIYDELLSSPYRSQTLEYITEDYTSTQIVYSVKSSASQDAITTDVHSMADRYRLSATGTGNTVVFQEIADTILASAIQSLAVALLATTVFLLLIYHMLEGRASLGLVNLVPIVVSVALLAGSMRLFDIPFNALTATILAIALGLGIDYSVHVVHRFTDEYELTDDVFAALERTVLGTGGALTGSMLTTASGIGVLVLALFPVLGQFGVLIALTVVYSYITALVVTPSVIVVWESAIA